VSVVARSMRSPPGRCVCGCAVDALSTRKVCLWLRGRCALHPAGVSVVARSMRSPPREGVSVVARSMRSPPRRCVCGCAVDALSTPPFGVSVVARSMRSPPRPSTGGGSINFLFASLTVTQRIIQLSHSDYNSGLRSLSIFFLLFHSTAS